MRKVIFLLLSLFPLLALARIDESQMLERLDNTIASNSQYNTAKEKNIKRLKRLASDATSDMRRLAYLDSLYYAYSTYRYDSATYYVEQGLQLAQAVGNREYQLRFQVNKASVLSVGGFYSQAEELLAKIPEGELSHELKMHYYVTYAWLYNYWASFCEKSEFAAHYSALKKKHLLLYLGACTAAERRDPHYYYFKGESLYLDHPTHRNVLAYFTKAMNQSAIDTRIHASSAYGVARYFLDTERYDLYEKYLVEAAVSDIHCQLKETLALQKLAYFLFRKGDAYSERAARYIRFSMSDAQFFNNRLRMMEISNVLPVIAASQQQAAERSRTRFAIGLGVVSVILVVMVVMAIVNTQQKRRLKRTRREIASKNMQLEEINARLVATNKRRETYMRLFMDISAVYIRKLDDYRKLVSRKIKANQVADLLRNINSYKLAEEESKMFYNRFDKAFLELYPDFVAELNRLLLPEHQIQLPQPGTLTTEVRIFALMRLGVTDSQEVATLLFYSTQTIYNYKSGMRAKAKNRDTFEEDINRLCHLI